MSELTREQIAEMNERFAAENLPAERVKDRYPNRRLVARMVCPTCPTWFYVTPKNSSEVVCNCTQCGRPCYEAERGGLEKHDPRVRVERLFVPDLDWGCDLTDNQVTQTSVLVCPFCNHDYVHDEPPVTLEEQDGRTIPASAEFVHTMCSGGGIAIPFWCEREGHHRWYLCVGHHKGKTFVFASKHPMHGQSVYPPPAIPPVA